MGLKRKLSSPSLKLRLKTRGFRFHDPGKIGKVWKSSAPGPKGPKGPKGVKVSGFEAVQSSEIYVDLAAF